MQFIRSQPLCALVVGDAVLTDVALTQDERADLTHRPRNAMLHLALE